MKQKKALKILSALAQDTRISIFRLLVQKDKDGMPAGMIAEILGVPAATLSFHLAQMTNAKLLKSRKQGRVVFYAARKKSVKNLCAFLLGGTSKKVIKNSVSGSTAKSESDLFDEDIENDAE